MKIKKPELLVSVGSVKDVEAYFQAGADAVNIGYERYALRMPGSFQLSEIKESVKIAKGFQRNVYVSINALLHQEALEGLEDYISSLHDCGVDAIVYGDPAVLVSAQSSAPNMHLHWNTETTSTNYHTINYWAGKGAARAVLARELSLEDVVEIKHKTSIEIQAQIHGMTCIFHSKRELVSNFVRHQGQNHDVLAESKTRGMFLKEEKRSEQRYPIYEDSHGTHVMSYEDICMIEHLHAFVHAGIDSLKIESMLKTAEYTSAVVSNYRKALDAICEDPDAPIDPSWVDEIKSLQPIDRPLGTGFYFKDQIY